MQNENLTKAIHSVDFLKSDLMELLDTENRAEYLIYLKMIEQVNKIKSDLGFLNRTESD